MTGIALSIDLADAPVSGRECIRLAGAERPGFVRALWRRGLPTDVLEEETDEFPWRRLYVPRRFTGIVVKTISDFFDARQIHYSQAAFEYLMACSLEFQAVCQAATGPWGCPPRVGERPLDYDVH